MATNTGKAVREEVVSSVSVSLPADTYWAIKSRTAKLVTNQRTNSFTPDLVAVWQLEWSFTLIRKDKFMETTKRIVQNILKGKAAKKHVNKTFAVLARQQPRLVVLRNRLVQIAGELLCVCSGSENDLDKVLARGKQWPTAGLTLVPGIPRECHLNAARHWSKNPADFKIVTGYALDNDNI